jgi:hypothetical protein
MDTMFIAGREHASEEFSSHATRGGRNDQAHQVNPGLIDNLEIEHASRRKDVAEPAKRRVQCHG